MGSDDDAEARRERANTRRLHATLRKATLRDREEDLSPLRGAAAVDLVTKLTRESWALTGMPLPSYERKDVPIRFDRSPRK